MHDQRHRRSDIDFGIHTRGAVTEHDSEGTLNVNCPVGTAYTIGLDAGLNPADTTASATNRQMISGSDLIPYGLYRDSARTQFWGNVIGTDTLAGTGTGVTVQIPVYGRVPSTDYPPGNYEDTVTATITY
ncbi:spore coat U domain-containing protein [Orrella sp. JC864]|uniref:Csu type fimbrial protein n=1 Tax=Orrella sp. JC864 TaxID=3120298 RepID=UPI00300BF327